MQRVAGQVVLVAQRDCPVVITGETGAGKDRLAREIHQASSRRSGPFIRVNCGAIPESLIESEFFGHRKGAFTGADEDRRGFVQEADGGTLFLDEIAELPPKAQAALLTFIDRGEFRRLGDPILRHADVRFIAATNKSLPDEVRARRFREDLHYRLNVAALHLPPLRERPEDLREEIETWSFLRAAETGLPAAFTPDAWQRIQQHRWPGNFRELKSFLKRLELLEPKESITVEQIQSALDEGWGGAGSRSAEDRRAEALHALKESGGRIGEAAKRLGVYRGTLRRWLKGQ
jgi:DNA-binding NtrC family response regulator